MPPRVDDEDVEDFVLVVAVFVVVFLTTMISPALSPEITSVFPPLLIPIVISVRIVSIFAVVVVVLLHEFRDPENPDQLIFDLMPENAHSPLPD